MRGRELRIRILRQWGPAEFGGGLPKEMVVGALLWATVDQIDDDPSAVVPHPASFEGLQGKPFKSLDVFGRHRHGHMNVFVVKNEEEHDGVLGLPAGLGNHSILDAEKAVLESFDSLETDSSESCFSGFQAWLTSGGNVLFVGAHNFFGPLDVFFPALALRPEGASGNKTRIGHGILQDQGVNARVGVELFQIEILQLRAW